MDGVLVVDKPEGITSHDVVTVARRCLREKRIGHTGTLDPMATGVLPLACGRATRLVRFLTASDKDYTATIRFGLTTDSYDITGEETGRTDRRPTREAIEGALAALRGEYLQMPPAFSAKKVGGTRAYALARRDAPVDLKPAPVRVARAELTRFDGEEAIVELTCSAGFYVRSFASDLGGRLGMGACLSALRRTRSGEFGAEQAMTIQEMQAGHAELRLVPLEQLLPRFPAVRLTDDGYVRVAHGREVDAPHVEIEGSSAIPTAEWVRLLTRDGRLVALASPGSREGSLHPSLVLI